MLISISLYVFNVVCASARLAMQNCPRQLAMQSCALCLYVRCGSSNQNKRRRKKKEKKSNEKRYMEVFHSQRKCGFVEISGTNG